MAVTPANRAGRLRGGGADATLARVSRKKRTSGNRGSNRQGLSGNPQRRAEQLQLRRTAAGEPWGPWDTESPRRELSEEDRQAFADLAYRLAGGARVMDWWPASHERVISQAIARPLPERLVDIETLACEVVGDEFYERLNSDDTGLAPAQWLRALAEKAGARLAAAIPQPGKDPQSDGDWRKLWALLSGLALIAPIMAPTEHSRRFPDIRFPYDTALEQLDAAAKLLAERGKALPAGIPEDEWEPGEVLVARDAYGSRFLLAVPYVYGNAPAAQPDHWYAWDIDACWITTAVSAGVFASAADALAEWRAAVGATASAAGLTPCRSDLAVWVLQPALGSGPIGELLQGYESREVIREYFRLRRRGQILVDCLPEDDEHGDDALATLGVGVELSESQARAFLDWHAARHTDAARPGTRPGKLRKATRGALDMLLGEWGTGTHPDERSLFACSPHRIEMTARLVRDEFEPDDANAALRLLPEWAAWCAERGGIDGNLAARALNAARAEAANLLAKDERYVPPPASGSVPFRRPE